MKYRITYDGITDPTWFNSHRSGTCEGRVNYQGLVELDGVLLKFISAYDEHGREVESPAWPAAGTPMLVWLDRWFYCETAASRDEQRARWAAEQQVKDEARRQRLNQRRADAEARATDISSRLPVAWEPAIKDVLSGLSENSNGNGTNRATVYHVRLLGDLRVGRVSRAKGDMLCTTRAGSNGKGWSNEAEAVNVDGDGNGYPAQVTCKACLKIISKLPLIPLS